jgi:hypothetical protein
MHYYTHEELDGATRASLNGFARTIKLRGRSKLKVNELRDALRERLPPREGTSPGLFVELCAGTAALSLRLHKEQAKPPVSRMGSKTGYANTILHELGLDAGCCLKPTVTTTSPPQPPKSYWAGRTKTRSPCGQGCARKAPSWHRPPVRRRGGACLRRGQIASNTWDRIARQSATLPAGLLRSHSTD